MSQRNVKFAATSIVSIGVAKLSFRAESIGNGANVRANVELDIDGTVLRVL